MGGKKAFNVNFDSVTFDSHSYIFCSFFVVPTSIASKIEKMLSFGLGLGWPKKSSH